MKRIGILSDTHAFLHPKLFEVFKETHEIWHAGDIGNLQTYDELSTFKPLHAVYGNIDGQDVRARVPEVANFICEGIKICIMHIGGYPGRYSQKAKTLIAEKKPGIFISGHSHILKVMPDRKNNLLHINPGAAGRFGAHKQITMIRLEISEAIPSKLEVIELDRF